MPERVQRDERPKWSSSLAIICIVFGAIGIACHGLCTPLSLFGQDSFMDFAISMNQGAPGTADLEGMMDATRRLRPYAIVITAFSAILSITLLVGGIQLSRQMPIAFTVLMVWAVVRILLAVGNLFFDWAMNRAQTEMMTQQTGGTGVPAGMDTAMTLVGALTILLTFAFRIALPIAVIWYFAPKKRRPAAMFDQIDLPTHTDLP